VSALLDDGAATTPEPETGPESLGVADGALAGIAAQPSTVGGAVYLLVIAATAVGLGIVEWGSWRLGVKVIGVAVLVAAVTRACLNSFNSGMLRVRSKPFDLVLLTTLGVTLIVLAIVVPNQTA
jgi:hypothetical protein